MVERRWCVRCDEWPAGEMNGLCQVCNHVLLYQFKLAAVARGYAPTMKTLQKYGAYTNPVAAIEQLYEGRRVKQRGRRKKAKNQER